jgi:hypothetical protein
LSRGTGVYVAGAVVPDALADTDAQHDAPGEQLGLGVVRQHRREGLLQRLRVLVELGVDVVLVAPLHVEAQQAPHARLEHRRDPVVAPHRVDELRAGEKTPASSSASALFTCPTVSQSVQV